MRLEPAGDCVEVLLRQSDPCAEFLRGDPAVKLRRAGSVELIDELFEIVLLVGGAPQLEQHVLHGVMVSNRTAIVAGVRFDTRLCVNRSVAVGTQGNKIVFRIIA